jgi:hypothetical protein
MVNRDTDEIRDVKVKAREAVVLAMASKWKEAAALNREITETSPGELDAWNRLGKALLELGDANASKASFEKTLAIDPANSIARKNIERLRMGSYASSTRSIQVDYRMFNGDSGKSTQVMLMGVGTGKDRPYLAPGGAIDLRSNNGNLTVFSSGGGFVGVVPPQLGCRLVQMTEAGNRYEGAIASTTIDSVMVVLRESYQHPSQRSKISFPASSVTARQQSQPQSLEGFDDSLSPPLDISFVNDDAGVIEARVVGVGMLMNEGLLDNNRFEEVVEEA